MRITKAQFTGLDQYKYSGIDKSVLSRHVLTPWWNWLVTCFPLTLAPNAVGIVRVKHGEASVQSQLDRTGKVIRRVAHCSAAVLQLLLHLR